MFWSMNIPWGAVISKDVKRVLSWFVAHVVKALVSIADVDTEAHRVDAHHDARQPLVLALAQHLLLATFHQAQAAATSDEQPPLKLAHG
jgi:predicted deacetylase